MMKMRWLLVKKSAGWSNPPFFFLIEKCEVKEGSKVVRDPSKGGYKGVL